MTPTVAFIGIGTNLGDRAANVERAVDALRSLGTIARRSSLYRTQPWGKRGQPWFLNAVIALETALTPEALLPQLKQIEARMGRTANERWGPRVIDLDLLLYGDLTIETPELHVPHPHLRDRAFVLVPLSEIDGRFDALRDALPRAELAGVVRVERESALTMLEERPLSAGDRVRALARFLDDSDAIRVRIARGDEEIELAANSRSMAPAAGRNDHGYGTETPAARVDTIKADLVGIFHLSRPVALEGEIFNADRELGYIEALGIRTPVHSMGAGRLVSMQTPDGSPVEYGQPLFLVARGR
ncbi:MAG: 2-amino-4-hydroxy-6-hydroxymethyldihydropteridine diphosphokinase [Candidatus Eremiobacteraeota bacterium]|nr:2-amino-4-hydroxy-6-hydroxymethyldihydropteridine diphosphokinase [Candidatus Eremiobacteraeota bacterium]